MSSLGTDGDQPPGSNHDGDRGNGVADAKSTMSSLGKRMSDTAQALTTTSRETVVADAEYITVANLSATGCIK
jgi:hypothetical protein